MNATDSLQEKCGESGKKNGRKKEGRERNGDLGELALPRSLHSGDEVVETFVDSLSKPACSPRSVPGTGVIREVHCQKDVVSPLTPRGLPTYPSWCLLPISVSGLSAL